MFLIEFNRFVTEPETREEIGQGITRFEKVLYHKEFDLTAGDNTAESLCQAKDLIKRWRKEHYGSAAVYSTSDGVIKLKLVYTTSNGKKFWRDMIALGVLVIDKEKLQ